MPTMPAASMHEIPNLTSLLKDDGVAVLAVHLEGRQFSFGPYTPCLTSTRIKKLKSTLKEKQKSETMTKVYEFQKEKHLQRKDINP